MKHCLKIILLALLGSLLIACRHNGISERTEFVIGTVCTVKIPQTTSAENILKDCFSELQRLETILSANSNSSELARVNTTAHKKPVAVSDELFELVALSKKISEQTDGAFDPAIGALVKLWGIGFENERIPEQAEIEAALPFAVSDNIALNMQTKEIFLRSKNTKIDLGAIAKGYAADKIVMLLKKQGVHSAVLDFGGNVFVLGKKFFTDEDWTVGIRNPARKNTELAFSLKVNDTSVVTSGIYERFFFKDGIRYHHVLDPKTGYPVRNNLASVSVVCKSSAYADALATAFFVLGYEKTKAVLPRFEKNMRVIFIFADGSIEELRNM